MDIIKFQKGNIPIYFQFYLFLKKNILIGETEPGSRLPTIENLAQSYGIAGHSVRRALALLSNEGLIVKKPGIGISIPRGLDFSLPDIENVFKGQFINLLQEGYPKIKSNGWKTPPKRVERIFSRQPAAYRNGKLYHIKVLLIFKGSPENKRLADLYFSAEMIDTNFAGPAQLIEKSLLIAQRQDLKYRIEHRPWLCGIQESKLLGVPDGTPVFHRTWIVRDKDNQTLFVSEGINTANLQVEEY